MEFLLFKFSKSYFIHFSIDQSSTNSNLLTAQPKYSGVISQPFHLRFNCSEHTAVVPEPMNGSRTISPIFDEAKINFLNNSSGFCVGCSVFSCMPLQVVGISITSFGFAPFGFGSQLCSLDFPLAYWLDSACG